MKLGKDRNQDVCLRLATCLSELTSSLIQLLSFKRRMVSVPEPGLCVCSTLNPDAACKASNCSFSFPEALVLDIHQQLLRSDSR